MSGVMHRFNPKWFYDYPDWLDYSVSLDASFCLPCYLFKNEDVHQYGGDLRFLLDQGMTFRGHDEGVSSSNKANFSDSTKANYTCIHYFSHQLQLTLVGISKKSDEVVEVVNLVSAVLNVARASFKCRDELRDTQILKVQNALEVGELQTGRRLTQELGLARPSDTYWEFHFKSFVDFILLFDSVIDVLNTIGTDVELSDEKWKTRRFLDTCLKFKFVFMLHFMKNILSITNELYAALQKKEPDIINATLLVGVGKKQLQTTRDTGWNSLIDYVSTFCIKHDIEIPRFDSFYVFRGKSKWKVAKYTILHHYRVKVFYKVID
ncbi:hypothetical protein CDL12_13833 [Handroanthus impetiginosus]|uniref:TTF-type domain-containing protein n=1 Tax=Handroanthus impetiginosus TaxID=429701 RepID=A0A2G9H7P5_9LAMI|nr:hypothetical protein CDL12_13833 [Handroanthus impetiginosus]